MINYDKLKIVSELKNIKIYDENRFNKIVKNSIVTELIFNMTSPFLLCIKLDYADKELVIEFSGKILGNDYPKLISLDTIETCFEHINDMGFCSIDPHAMMNSKVVKCDVTKDIPYQDVPCMTTFIRNNLSNYQKYVCRLLRNGNFIVEKNVITRQAKKRLTIYDKGQEMSKVENRQFMKKFGIREDRFHQLCRFELNLNSISQIKTSLNVRDTSLQQVLTATVNPIRSFMDEVLAADEQCTQITRAKSYFTWLVLKDCHFDIVQVENKIRQIYPSKGTNISKVMKPYRMMLAQLQQGEHNKKSELLDLLT